MRRLPLHLILFSALITASVPGVLLAQDQQQTQGTPDQQGPPPAPDMGGPRHAPNPRHEAKHMAKMLGLSADQQQRLEPILASRMQRMQALRADTTLGPDQRHAQMQAIMADTNSQISQVLTDQQNQQWQQMKQQHRQQRQQEQQQQPQDQQQQPGAPGNSGQD